MHGRPPDGWCPVDSDHPPAKSTVSKVKVVYISLWKTHREATNYKMLTAKQCYLPPDTDEQTPP